MKIHIPENTNQITFPINRTPASVVDVSCHHLRLHFPSALGGERDCSDPGFER
jgi:hypothetical protein